jgi:hypothetical protein
MPFLLFFFILKISIKGGGEVEYQIIDTRKEEYQYVQSHNQKSLHSSSEIR